MKTIHDYLCDCCPPDADRRMKLWAESFENGSYFSWGTAKPCARDHYPLTIDSDALKAAHAKAQPQAREFYLNRAQVDANGSCFGMPVYVAHGVDGCGGQKFIRVREVIE